MSRAFKPPTTVTVAGSVVSCVHVAQDSLQQCYAACKETYLDPPPTLELPDGNSPGQGN